MASLDKYLDHTFSKIVDAYKDELNAVMDNPRYWGQGFGRTKRMNGEVVEGGFRNIVDTGELRDSLIVSSTGRFEVEFEWTADHAVTVHEGSRNQPPRPFTREAAEELDNNLRDILG